METWRLKNDFLMKHYGERIFSFEFATKEDRVKVLEIGCFHIASQLFVVRLWQLLVEEKLEEMKTILFGLYSNVFRQSCGTRKDLVLYEVRWATPYLQITEERKRMGYARIRVEIDTKCKYPNNMTVVVVWQMTRECIIYRLSITRGLRNVIFVRLLVILLRGVRKKNHGH